MKIAPPSETGTEAGGGNDIIWLNLTLPHGFIKRERDRGSIAIVGKI